MSLQHLVERPSPWQLRTDGFIFSLSSFSLYFGGICFLAEVFPVHDSLILKFDSYGEPARCYILFPVFLEVLLDD